MRAIPENIDRRQSILTENIDRRILAQLAMAILDGGQYSKVLLGINSYYMDYYQG